MTILATSPLNRVALTVGAALRKHGVRGVLTGGACVSLYTKGLYHSKDVDFVLAGTVTREKLDTAMATVGFTRQRDRYEHPRTSFYVEFPPGPLAIGADFDIRPIDFRRYNLRILTLSATDCCRDRLAAFYHWNDRQSLRAAVMVAVGNRIRTSTVKAWSHGEGAADGFAEFQKELTRAKQTRARRGRAPSPLR